MQSKTVLLILFCGIFLLLIYAVNWFHIMYRLTPWDRLGETPVIPVQIIYFVADTPNIIGYLEPETGESVTCAQAVAYVSTTAGKNYRCCDAGQRISCLAGDFSTEIPATDPACTDRLRLAFGVPDSLTGVNDYEASGDCTEGGNPQLTVVQLDAENRIQWKAVSGFQTQVLNGVLRCILGPALILLAAWAFYTSRKKADPDRQIRRW
jgi:hypothetical protein